MEQALRGPESYTLATPEVEVPPAPAGTAASIPPGSEPQERPVRQGDASAPRACAAEVNPFRQHLCEVRRQLGAGE